MNYHSSPEAVYNVITVICTAWGLRVLYICHLCAQLRTAQQLRVRHSTEGDFLKARFSRKDQVLERSAGKLETHQLVCHCFIHHKMIKLIIRLLSRKLFQLEKTQISLLLVIKVGVQS